jgi:hypothetical protein
MYLTFRAKNKFKRLSYILVVCNNKNKPIRKLGSFFYSNNLRKFIVHADLILIYLVISKGLKFDSYFFFILSKYVNLNYKNMSLSTFFNY